MLRVLIPRIDKWAKCEGVSSMIEALESALHSEESVTFDFSQCHFISAEAVAILAGMKLLRDEMTLETKIDTDTLEPLVKRVLGKSRFLSLFGHDVLPWTDNSLPIFRQTKLSVSDTLNYINTEILRPEMPEMSSGLQKQIKLAFFELFGNVFHHSESAIGGVACGQVYPKDREIQIVLHDTGIGIARRVRSAVTGTNSDADAIQWALQRGTSTLSNHEESRGLGLFLLRQFLALNGGEFRIYANQGFVEEISGSRNCGDLDYKLKGTLIDMRVRVRKDIKYILSSEDK